MCRILCIPPGVNRKTAISILEDMVADNEHGTGSCYVENGKFVLNKYGQSLKKVLKKGKPFLNHLPHASSWTIIHLRKLSIGHQCKENAHPFISLSGDVATVHNGTLPNISWLSLYLQTLPGYISNTDSAVACELISKLSMKEFVDYANWGGVFGALYLDGSLQIGKVSGQLSIHRLPGGKALISSEFDNDKYDNVEVPNGWFKFSPEGTLVKHKIKKFHWDGGNDGNGIVYQTIAPAACADEGNCFSHVYTGKAPVSAGGKKYVHQGNGIYVVDDVEDDVYMGEG